MKRAINFVALSVCLIFTITACNDTVKKTETSTMSLDTPIPYPSEDINALDASYPEPIEELVTVVINEIPTPTKDFGTVTGIIKLDQKASENAILSLANVLYDDQGQPTMAQLDTNTKLRTLTDSNGRFVFTNVPPGDYALIYDLLTEAYMLNDPVTNEDFIVSVKPGEITDLEELIYNDLPGKTTDTE